MSKKKSWLSKWFNRTPPAPKQTPKERKHRDEMAKKKAAASEAHEPWVGILSMDVDMENIDAGNFELDWNDYFVTRLLKAGYAGKTDADIVDQWFTAVCRNVVLETYQQEQADRHPIKRQDLEDGRRSYE